MDIQPTINEWRILRSFAPNEAKRWQNELLWCEDCQEWHTPSSRGMILEKKGNV